jgi:hypothetical protein
MSGGHSGSLFQLSTTDDSREASHTRGLAAGVPPLPSHPGVRWELVTPMEYDLYNLADTHRRPCACLPSAWRRLCCWDNSFNLPGFNRAEYDGTLVELGVERHEFDELKRRVCDATDGYRATPFWLWLLFFPAVGTAAALQGTALRGTLAGAIFPILAVAVVYGVGLAVHDRVCKHNAKVDEQVDAVLGDLNARKGRAVCALRRDHVGTCKGRHNRVSRSIIFGVDARYANAPGYSGGHPLARPATRQDAYDLGATPQTTPPHQPYISRAPPPAMAAV